MERNYLTAAYSETLTSTVLLQLRTMFTTMTSISAKPRIHYKPCIQLMFLERVANILNKPRLNFQHSCIKLYLCLNKNNKTAYFCVVSKQNWRVRRERNVGCIEFNFTVLKQPKLTLSLTWWVHRITGIKTQQNKSWNGMECYYSIYICRVS